MNVALFIARRLSARGVGRERASLPAVRIAVFGVSAGLTVMILSVAIVQGFKDEISAKVVGFGSHVTVCNTAASGEGEASPVEADEKLVERIKRIPAVDCVQYFSLKQGVLKTSEQFAGITLKGISPGYDTRFISSHIVEGAFPDYRKAEAAGDIVISRSVADGLQVKAGDRIFAYFFDGALRVRRFRIAAVYRTDMSQFDEVLVFAAEKTVRSLCRWKEGQAYGLEIKIGDFSALDAAGYSIAKAVSAYNIENNTSYASYTVKESFPQIFDWLDLLDVNIWVIFALMTAVAGVTIVSGLLILILERAKTIALLKALGSSGTLVRKVFINLAVIILLRGMAAGDAVGLGLALLQKTFGIISLDPASYYIDTVPVKLDLLAIALINVAVFAVSTLALVLPSHMVSRIYPTKVLRYE